MWKKIQAYQGSLGNGTTSAIQAVIPQGIVVRALRLVMGGTMACAKVASMSVFVDGKDILQAVPGATLLKINNFNNNGLYTGTAYLDWNFGQPLARVNGNKFASRIGELDLIGTVAGNKKFDKDVTWVVTPDGTQDGTASVEFWYDEVSLSAVGKKPLPANRAFESHAYFRALRKATISVTDGAGEKTFTPPFSNTRRGAVMRQLHIAHAGTITSARWRVNTIDQMEKSLLASIQLNQTMLQRAPQSNLLCFDFTRGGEEGMSLSDVNKHGGVDNIEIMPTMSGNDTLTLWGDMYAKADHL